MHELAPDQERLAHYFSACLPQQFDEYVWFDQTTAIRPLDAERRPTWNELPDTYPFGL